MQKGRFIPVKKIPLEEGSPRAAATGDEPGEKNAWSRCSCDPPHCLGGLYRAELGLLQVSKLCVDSYLKQKGASPEQRVSFPPPPPPSVCLVRAPRESNDLTLGWVWGITQTWSGVGSVHAGPLPHSDPTPACNLPAVPSSPEFLRWVVVTSRFCYGACSPFLPEAKVQVHHERHAGAPMILRDPSCSP